MEYYPFPLDYEMGGLMNTLSYVATDGIFLIAERDGEPLGGIGGLVTPHYYAPMHLMASEMFLWVEEEYRNTTVGPRLLKAFEKEAESKGCKYVSMASTVRTPNFKTYLEKKGYTEAETAFVKEITNGSN